MIDGTKFNGRLVKKDEQNIYISTWDGKTLKIPQKGVYEIKIKKFSYLKTGVLISHPIIAITTFILFLGLLSGA